MKEIDKKFQKELKKILPLGKLEKSSRISHILLFKEYRRRLILWWKELGRDFVSPPKERSQQNLLPLIFPENYKSFKDIDEFRVNDLDKTNFNTSKYRGFDYLFIYLFIYWEIFEDSEQLKKYNSLPHLYLPVMRIVQRGGTISQYGGYFIISNMEVSRNPKYNSFILPSMDDDFLDYVDDRCGGNTMNIPSQDEIDLLWKEYNSGDSQQLFKKRHSQY